MDLITAVAILVQQCVEFNTTLGQLMSQSSQAQTLVGQENSVIAINPQVHALTANMNIAITAMQSQIVIVQQAVDKVAELSNS